LEHIVSGHSIKTEMMMMIIAIREKENFYAIQFKTTLRTMMPELLVLLFSLLFSLDGIYPYR